MRLAAMGSRANRPFAFNKAKSFAASTFTRLATPIAPIVHRKMNTGKEFPSAGIRFPSSPSIVRRAL